VIGCSTTQQLVLTTVEPAQASLVDPRSPDQVEKDLGKTPVELSSDEFRGKLVKLSQPGKLPQYVVPLLMDAPRSEVQIKLRTIREVPDIRADLTKGVDTNLTHRLLMESMEAMLVGNDITGALQKAEQLVNLDGSIASAFVMIGLCRLQLGETDAARQAFERANQLDPSDARPAALLANPATSP
jgi:hypothetical protein